MHDVTTLNNFFQERFSELVKEREFSQKEVAEGVGITRQAVSLYTTGQRTPDINSLYKICNFFNISADYLLGLSEVKSFDFENKAINKKLGLSEESIDIIEGLSYRYDFVCMGKEPNDSEYMAIDIFNKMLVTYDCGNSFEALIHNIWLYALQEESIKALKRWSLDRFCEKNHIEYDKENYTFKKDGKKLDVKQVESDHNSYSHWIICKIYKEELDSEYKLYKLAEDFKKICKDISFRLREKIFESDVFKDYYIYYEDAYCEYEETGNKKEYLPPK